MFITIFCGNELPQRPQDFRTTPTAVRSRDSSVIPRKMTSASPPHVSLPGGSVRANGIDAKIAGMTRRTDRPRIEATLSGIPQNVLMQKTHDQDQTLAVTDHISFGNRSMSAFLLLGIYNKLVKIHGSDGSIQNASTGSGYDA
jgi:hypothetical protein